MSVELWMTISAAVDSTLHFSLNDDRRGDAKWFSGGGCVVPDSGRSLVFIRGTLIGSFGPMDRGARNAILIGVAEAPNVHLGQLAEAFGVSSDGLRVMRGVYAAEGMGPLLTRVHGGSESKVTPGHRRRLEKLFESGATVSEAYAKAGDKHGISRATVGRVRLAWLTRKTSLESHAQAMTPANTQLSLVPPSAEVAPVNVVSPASKLEDVPAVAPPPVASNDASEDDGFNSEEVKSARSVQHLGTWLLIAVAHQLGLYRHAASASGGQVKEAALRLALDAVVAALAIGEGCVEGVRRLATATSAALLLASAAPSPTWTRRVLGRFAAAGRTTDDGLVGSAAALHLLMTKEYLAAAGENSSAAGPVFYVDNHMRPYTGKHDLRRGWRMQDKRALPGVSDYYVHDEDGRPVARFAIPSHDSLTKWLSPISRLLRLGLSEELKDEGKRVLVAFDRAGAFPEQLAELREEKFEFVTYERAPYRTLPVAAFTEKLALDEEELRFCESRANLGNGRGRVRRIAVRMPDGHQVNLLAVSRRGAEELIQVMRGRWTQENAFKHGVERWGINQLDGRQVVPYPPGTIIPNPARRRLDRALGIARVSEGAARNELARLKKGDPERDQARQSLEHALAQQQKLLALRPLTPTHAPLEDTELAQTLVHHAVEYKMTLDTIRIACANAETDLAAELSLHIPRAAEAKKTLANLFAAPGDIRVGERTINVCLSPAGTKPEQRAFSALLKVVNRWKLSLPGDQKRRQLRFGTSRKTNVS